MTPPPPENATLAASARRRRAAARESAAPPSLNAQPSIAALPPTDGELLGLFTRHAGGSSDAARRDSDAAFQRIVDRHGPMVWRVCRQVLPQRQDAEDAFQATFLILARRASAIRASESAAGWLYRVAHRTALAARRRARKRKQTRLETEPLAPPETAFPDLVGRETAGVMMEELAAMPTKYRTPLVMRYLEGRTRREIAEQTDATIPAVQGLLARGKSLLRRRLLRRGVSLSMAMGVVTGGARQTDAASANLLAQTSSNATAVAAGGSLAASTAVVLLYSEGLRAMFLNEAMKPLAVAAAVVLLATGVALGAGESADPPPRSEPALVLDAAAPEDAEAADGAATFVANLEESETELAAEPEPQGEVTNRVYYTDDLPPALFEWTKALTEAMPAEGDVQLRVYENNRSFVIAAPQAVHEQLADTLKAIRKAKANDPQAAARPTPKHGETIEYWPDGTKKAVREYQLGRLIEAVEYAEDGQTLFVFEDRWVDSSENRQSPEVSNEPAADDELLDEVEKLLDEADKGFALADRLTEQMTRENMERVQAMNLAANNQASKQVTSASQKLGAWHRLFTASALEKDDPLAAWEGGNKKRIERAESLQNRLARFGTPTAFGGIDVDKRRAVSNRFNARLRELFPENYKQPADESAEAEETSSR